MKGTYLYGLIAACFLFVTGAGCITPAQQKTAEAQVQTSPPDSEQVAASFVQQGKALEEQADLHGALRRYRIALTVAGDQEDALAGVGRLEAALKNQAEIRYQEGLALYEQGKYADARHEFLVALRLFPEHEKAAGMLVSRKRVHSTRYVVHRVMSGESLSKLAERYYENYRKFPEIARYNGLSDATQIMVGQDLKIPEIEGMPFHPGEVQVQTEEKDAPEFRLWEWGEIEASRNDPVDEEALRLAACRSRGMELFEKRKDRQALEALNQVLEISPDDEVALEYAFKAQFRLAERLLEKKQYLAARDGFRASLEIKGDCRNCHENIRKSEEQYKESHYRKGMQYFNQEKLRKALREWERVQRMDPGYKRVGYLIEKAKKIQKKLHDLKKDQ